MRRGSACPGRPGGEREAEAYGLAESSRHGATARAGNVGIRERRGLPERRAFFPARATPMVRRAGAGADRRARTTAGAEKETTNDIVQEQK